MKPFIFQFKEQPNQDSSDFSMLCYDKNLNLSIDKNTGEPAIQALQMATETMTKSNGEIADSDQSYLTRLMGTESVTLVNNEASDADHDRIALSMLLGTETETRTHIEQTDSDYKQ